MIKIQGIRHQRRKKIQLRELNKKKAILREALSDAIIKQNYSEMQCKREELLSLMVDEEKEKENERIEELKSKIQREINFDFKTLATEQGKKLLDEHGIFP